MNAGDGSGSARNGGGDAARKLFPEERHARILGLLEDQLKVRVKDLVRELGVSAFTVRADLDELERDGRLRRCHGGAVPLPDTVTIENYSKRLRLAAEAKRAIGEAAAALVVPGDSIIVDTGTTTIELVRHLHGVDSLTIVTNDLEIAALIERDMPQIKLLLLGGFVRPGYRYTYGEQVLRGVEDINVSKAFLSASGFSLEKGFTSESYDQAKIKSAYARHAAESIVLVDTSKLGTVTFSNFMSLSDADALVSESAFDADIRASIRRQNERIRLISAG